MAPSSVLEKPEIPTGLPPFDDDGDGGGGDGGGDDRPERPEGPPISASRLALLFVLGTVVMLFASTLSGYIILRRSAVEWPPPGYPPIPSTLWIPTLVIALSSVTAAFASAAARRGDERGVTLAIGSTLLMGLLFCGVQAWVWRDLIGRGLAATSSNYASNFFMMTGLHVAHVLVGIAVLAWCLGRSLGGAYTRDRREGLGHAMIYWHFVGGVWYVLFFALYII